MRFDRSWKKRVSGTVYSSSVLMSIPSLKDSSPKTKMMGTMPMEYFCIISAGMQVFESVMTVIFPIGPSSTTNLKASGQLQRQR